MTLSNWNDSARSTPATIAAPRNLQELIDVVRNANGLCPSPVRAIGSLHSLNECFTTTGTAVLMKHFDEIRPPVHGTVTVGAGVRMFDLKNKLKKLGLQIPVVPEIGNATAGSVACCGTKDASLPPSNLGQIASTVVQLKMVDATGAPITICPISTPPLEAVRSSYGLLGIVYEVTFKVHARTLVMYGYASLPLDPVPPFTEVRGSADGFLGFLLPYRRQLVVERRRLVKPPRRLETLFARLPAPVRRTTIGLWDRFALWLRTKAWNWGARPFRLPVPLPRFITRRSLTAYVWLLDRGLRWFLLVVLGTFTTYRADAMIDFKRRRHSYFDFTFWAFPVSQWSTIVPEYLDFCERFLSRTGFRPALPSEVYFITKDDSAWLSFSRDEDIFTLDMVNWTDYYPTEWRAMNNDFNVFAAKHGGRPLFNQTKHPSRAVAAQAMSANPHWPRFRTLRSAIDPDDRFLNAFFRNLV